MLPRQRSWRRDDAAWRHAKERRRACWVPPDPRRRPPSQRRRRGGGGDMPTQSCARLRLLRLKASRVVTRAVGHKLSLWPRGLEKGGSFVRGPCTSPGYELSGERRPQRPEKQLSEVILTGKRSKEFWAGRGACGFQGARISCSNGCVRVLGTLPSLPWPVVGFAPPLWAGLQLFSPSSKIPCYRGEGGSSVRQVAWRSRFNCRMRLS